MNKILLALTMLSAGAGVFHTARQSTNQLAREANAAREAWQAQMQRVTAAQSEQASLAERIRELKQSPAQPRSVGASALWSILQTNRADRLSPELRDRLREELGFHWRSWPDFILVSKQTVRDLQLKAITLDGKLNDLATTVLAMTPEERGQVEAALDRVRTDFKEWVLVHVERREPAEEVLAHYLLPNGREMSLSISNAFATTVLEALGRERAELVLPTAQSWIKNLGLYDCDSKPPAFIIRRDMVDNEKRFTAQVDSYSGSGGTISRYLPPLKWGEFPAPFPQAFRFYFPDGWADVAKREGFELPPEPEKKQAP